MADLITITINSNSLPLADANDLIIIGNGKTKAIRNIIYYMVGIYILVAVAGDCKKISFHRP